MKTLPANVDRKTYIGSSDAAAIMDLAPKIDGMKRTPLAVYMSKIGEMPEPVDPRRRRFLDRRKAWEPIVEQVLKDEYDAKIVARNKRYVDPTIPYLAAEIDLEVEMPDGEIVNVETKTVRPEILRLAREDPRYNWGEPGTDEVPIHYFIQVQFGLGLTHRKRAFVPAFPGLDEDLRLYPIHYDGPDITRIREACARFWNQHVLPRVAPEPQSALDVALLFRGSVERSVEATPEVAMAALRLRALLERADADTAEAEMLEFLVKRQMGDAEKLLVEGKTIFSWKEGNAPGWLDQEGLKLTHPEIYKQFYNKGGRRRTFRRAAWRA